MPVEDTEDIKMSKYYKMSLGRLRDELDALEEQLWDFECENPDDYDGRRRLQDIINNVCNLIHRLETA